MLLYLINSLQYFGGIYYLHLQGRRSKIWRNKIFSTVKWLINVLGTRSTFYSYIWYADAVTPWHAAQYYICSLSINWCVYRIDINVNLFNMQYNVLQQYLQHLRFAGLLCAYQMVIIGILYSGGFGFESRLPSFCGFT